MSQDDEEIVGYRPGLPNAHDGKKDSQEIKENPWQKFQEDMADH